MMTTLHHQANRIQWIVRSAVRRNYERLKAVLTEIRSPRTALRRSMSRANEARGPVHQRLQTAYRSRRLKRFLANQVVPGESAFDIGANRGEWTMALRSLTSPVVAVEPQAECTQELEAKFSRDPGVRIVSSAVAEQAGSGALHRTTTSTEHASMSEEWREASGALRVPSSEWLDPIEVPVTTLDKLIEEHGAPGFCKVDVEGLEPEVFRGLGVPLSSVAFEFHHEMLDAVKQCVERLEQLGRYSYGLYLDEWPDRFATDLDPERLTDEIATLPRDSWGMVTARLQR
jgi:FkbM family methyltransferase